METIVFLLIFGFSLWQGRKKGVIPILVQILGIIVGWWVCYRYAHTMALWFMERGTAQGLYAYGLAFVVILGGTSIVAALLMYIIKNFHKWTRPKFLVLEKHRPAQYGTPMGAASWSQPAGGTISPLSRTLGLVLNGIFGFFLATTVTWALSFSSELRGLDDTDTTNRSPIARLATSTTLFMTEIGLDFLRLKNRPIGNYSISVVKDPRLTLVKTRELFTDPSMKWIVRDPNFFSALKDGSPNSLLRLDSFRDLVFNPKFTTYFDEFFPPDYPRYTDEYNQDVAKKLQAVARPLFQASEEMVAKKILTVDPRTGTVFVPEASELLSHPEFPEILKGVFLKLKEIK